MNKFLSIAMVSVTALFMGACSTKAQKEASEAPKYLVLYYSTTGTTKTLATELQQQLNADIEAIEIEEPYSDDYDVTLERCRKEREEGITPKVKPLKSDLSKYDVVFLGYPVWFGTYALPIAGLVKDVDFAGKTIVPFCTFGSGGLESSSADLQAALPKAKVVEGYGVRTARTGAIHSEVARFLIEGKYIDGEVTPLPEYSEQQPVSADDQRVFNEACSGYRFPLGTPVTTGKRLTDEGTDYKFIAKSVMPGTDDEITATIYVTVSNDSTISPVFTRVVR
jgi:flavodoxin